MNNLSKIVIKELPEGLGQLYCMVFDTANKHNIELFIIGAMARDLVLVYGFDARLERATRDVDFAIQVENWNDFKSLVSSLIHQGFTQDPKQVHKLHYQDTNGLPWEIDILPFGLIAGTNFMIKWPPNQDTAMMVLGFDTVFEHALQVIIECSGHQQIIRVASPAGLSLLKLIAWLEREPSYRKKDAQDIYYLIQTYSKIPDIYDALYEDGNMEAQDWEEDKASAMKLGQDAARLTNRGAYDYLSKNLFLQPDKLELFGREMRATGNGSALLNVYVEAFCAEFEPV